MELVDVVDSKSTAGDSVPVRVRSPAPINPIVNDTFTMGVIFCTGRTRTAGESLGSEGSAAGGRNTWGPRKAGFAGKGEAKTQVEFSACGKCNIVACALTKRVAAVGVQRSRTDGKAHTGHRNRTPAP